VSVLADRVREVHAALAAAGIPHAFGGALALAYCTEEPRGTRDMDVNVFVGADQAGPVLGALPKGVAVDARDVAAAEQGGQVRVWWEDTPVDVFFDVHEFHDVARASVRVVPFSGVTIPVLGCDAVAVFKVVFNRTRDWAGVEAMLEVDAFDRSAVIGWVVRLFGPEDERTTRLLQVITAR
jgi:hypothetical protein